MKKFHEFMANKPQMNTQSDDDSGVFDTVGMNQQDMTRFMRTMRQMLSNRGVVQSGDDKQAAMKVLSIMRPPIMRLVNMGLSPDDLMLVIQQVINLIIGMRSQTGLNVNRVRNKIADSMPQQD